MPNLAKYLMLLSYIFACPPTLIAAEKTDKLTASDFQRILADPAQEALLQDFLRKAPKYELKDAETTRTFYVAEGDLLLTEPQMRAYIYRHAYGSAPVRGGSGELLVLIDRGKPVFWKKDERHLTYAVDRRSFASADQYALVSKNMVLATKDWEAACADCGLSFTYRKEFDVNPDSNAVTFIVRFAADANDFIAAAFFPNDPPFKRNVLIGPQYFTTTFDKVGVLRHETGHIIGYRHEQNVGVPGCIVEDDQWKPLTAYDPHSVMHYLCGGGGSMDFKITKIDREGHQKLYH
ncbi:hypothetical protein [Methylocystis sp.]|uniref:hypothetical protein n=1 Tax=Methylocystis sp. TaxID=1911079 RepID=UPI003DA58C63